VASGFYSVENAAEKLGVHTRTVLRFINQGKLKANKVGRQWRIKETDLLSLLGQNIPLRKIEASSVIDIPVTGESEANRIHNAFIPALNNRTRENNNHRVDFLYNSFDGYVRFTLWGSVSFMKDFYTLLENIL